MDHLYFVTNNKFKSAVGLAAGSTKTIDCEFDYDVRIIIL